MAYHRYLCIAAVVLLIDVSSAIPQQGRWDFTFSQDNQIVSVTKATYNNTKLFLKLDCVPGENDNNASDISIVVSFVIRKLFCSSEIQSTNDSLMAYHLNPEHPLPELYEHDVAYVFKSEPETLKCDRTVMLRHWDNQKLKIYVSSNNTLAKQQIEENDKKPEMLPDPESLIHKREVKEGNKTSYTSPPVKLTTVTSVVKTDKPTDNPTGKLPRDSRPQFILQSDGIYLITVAVKPEKPNVKFEAQLDMEIMGSSGYLSAKDWPLLPFYGIMCLLYVMYGVGWLIVLGLQWRDLLRVQYWIGGVILLGMLESAVFYAEFQSVNSTGKSVKGAMLFAEIVSCMKRSLARMLVIIVSLGFGIVKPRLGPMLHRVVGVGLMYFILASIDGVLRVMETDRSSTQQMILGQMPLTVLDAAICWWIFSSLVQTTRTLRLRRNIVKLNLYRHFTNTLAFAVIASVPFMIWTIRTYKMSDCITDWKELWVEQAYWPFLFSMILLVIMILWRPSANNQRYAFSPLLDTSDDEEEEEMLPNGAFEGMKIRNQKNQSDHAYKDSNDKSNIEADLKWVDEHIPSSMADVALPALLDSDEEVMNTEFEISKMQ